MGSTNGSEAMISARSINAVRTYLTYATYLTYLTYLPHVTYLTYATYLTYLTYLPCVTYLTYPTYSTYLTHPPYAPFATSLIASRATRIVFSTSRTVCAAERNQASNCDGGGYTPRVSIPRKNLAY